MENGNVFFSFPLEWIIFFNVVMDADYFAIGGI